MIKNNEIINDISKLSNNEIDALLTDKDKKIVAKWFSEEKEEYNNGKLFYNQSDINLDAETERLLLIAIEDSLKRIRLINKAKYTPKKYRK